MRSLLERICQKTGYFVDQVAVPIHTVLCVVAPDVRVAVPRPYLSHQTSL